VRVPCVLERADLKNRAATPTLTLTLLMALATRTVVVGLFGAALAAAVALWAVILRVPRAPVPSQADLHAALAGPHVRTLVHSIVHTRPLTAPRWRAHT
jgi:hypothetical protein